MDLLLENKKKLAKNLNTSEILKSKTISILLIEDSPTDADLISYYLNKNENINQFQCDISHVKYLKRGLDLLSKKRFDIILLDLSLPDSLGLDTFLKVHKSFPKIPIIACTGFDDSLGVTAVKYGAQDFLSKEDLNGLMIKKSIKYAIERNKNQLDLKKLNNELDNKVQQRTKQLSHEKWLVEKKNNEIINNLNYARHIQISLMSQERHLSQLISECFVFNNPCDIVGGDFYWYNQIGEELVIAVADCTGHGVSGALLSINGWTLLNQLIIENKETNPSKILSNLSNCMKKSLQNDRGTFQPNDGMDIALCSINLKSMKLRYSGANRPLYLFKNGNLSLLSGTRTPIGGITTNKNTVYDLHELNIERNDMIYLFSDGYSDQFGGDGNKKIKRTNFIKFLQLINEKTLNEQRNILMDYFNSWKGNNEQTDDVLVLGLRI